MRADCSAFKGTFFKPVGNLTFAGLFFFFFSLKTGRFKLGPGEVLYLLIGASDSLPAQKLPSLILLHTELICSSACLFLIFRYALALSGC